MNKKQLIALAVVLGVIVVGVVGFATVKNMIIKGDPFNHLFYSMTQNSYDSVEARIEGNIEVDEAMLQSTLYYFTSNPEAMSKFVASLLNEVNITGDVKWAFSMKDKTVYLDENIHLNYSDKQMLSFGVGYSGERLSLRSQTFTDKIMVLTKQEAFDLIRESSGVDLTEVDFNKYIDLFDLEKDPLYKTFIKDVKGYEKILRDKLANLEKGDPKQVVLADGKTIKCDTIELEMTIDEMTMLYIALLNEAKFDVELKTLVKSKAMAFLTLLKESDDYKLMNIDASDVDSAMDELSNNFDSGWETAIDELARTYQEMQYELQRTQVEPFRYKMLVAIDPKFNIRMVEYSTNMMGIAVNQTMYYDRFNAKINDGLVFDESKMISIKKMIDDESYAKDTASTLIEESINTFMDSASLEFFMTDVKAKASVLPAQEATAIVEMVQYFIDNKEMIKSMLLENMGM